MVSEESGAGRSVTLDDELREDAVDVLRDALVWQLDAVRWSVVSTAVDALTTALRDGDVEAVRATVYELELAGPVRAVGMGDTPLVDAPEPVREEINELIHTLDAFDGGPIATPQLRARPTRETGGSDSS